MFFNVRFFNVRFFNVRFFNVLKICFPNSYMSSSNCKDTQEKCRSFWVEILERCGSYMWVLLYTIKVNHQQPISARLRPIQKMATPIKLPISPLPEMINQICKTFSSDNSQDKKTGDDTCDIFQK